MALGSKYNADGYSSGVLDDLMDDNPIPLGAPRRRKARSKTRATKRRVRKSSKPTKRTKRRVKRKSYKSRTSPRRKRKSSTRSKGRKKLVQFRDKKTGRMIKFYAKR